MNTKDVITSVAAIIGIFVGILTINNYISPEQSHIQPSAAIDSITSATTGSISVSSYPSGTSIDLDGSYKGTSPMTIKDVEAGSHTITLKYSGYQDWYQSISVRADDTTYVSPSLTPNPTPTPTLTFLESVSGSYTLISWVEAPSPYTLAIDVKSGTLSIDNTGDAGWQLVIQPSGQNIEPTPGIECGGRVSISSQLLEGVPGGDKNGAINWPSDISSTYQQNFLTFCGWAVLGQREPFSLYIEKRSDGKKILEMKNTKGTFIWSR